MINSKLFGPHEAALRVAARRNEVLATNIANADTPHYKARDIDFRSVLRTESGSRVALVRTSERHLTAPGVDRETGAEVQYRVPTQPSLDGNTVESDIEQAAYAENIVRYRASLMFINGRIQSFRQALTGER